MCGGYYEQEFDKVNIIFEGDWIKFNNKWRHVIEILELDHIRLYDAEEYLVIDANSPLIEKVVSDLEMQEILEAV